MPSEHAELLTQRAHEFAEQLQSVGIQAKVLDATLREYSIKLDLPQGKAVLYYKPKKASFQCQPENVTDDTLWARVVACWDGHAAPTACSVNASPLKPDISTEVYVDGSWVDGTTSYGMVVVQSDALIWEGAGIVASEDAGDSRQVAGELQAVRSAVLWCQEHGIQQVVVHYDYAGIEHWATGKWKAKLPLTQRYKADIENSGIAITWRKVEAHTGVKWNERADTLANSAASKVSKEKPSAQAPSLDEVQACVSAFADFLRPKGVVVEVRLKQEAPIPHVQASVTSGTEPWGYLNVYGSAGKEPYAKFHEIRPAEKQGSMEQLWRQFKAPPVNELDEVDYYLQVFKPYADLHFDFRLLADAIARVWDIHMAQPLDRDVVRYSFAGLKECVALLRRQTAGEIQY